MKAEHAIVTRQSSRTCCTGPSHCAYVKARLHRRFLSRQLNAIFVALKLQLKNRTCKPAAILDATIRQTSNCLSFCYGPTSLEGKRTHNCGMDGKRVWVETPCLVLVPSQSRRSRPYTPYREIERKTDCQQST